MADKVPVILGGYVNGYSLARGFRETRGLVSIVLDYCGRLAGHSRFTDFRLCPNPEGEPFLGCLEELGRKLSAGGKRGVLIATNDEWMIPVSKAKDRLKQFFDSTISDWDILERVTVKDRFYTLCEETGIRYPKTLIQRGRDLKGIELLAAPVLCKPSEVVEFIKKFPGQRRNRVFASPDELGNYLLERRDRGFDIPFVLQEYVPGGAENLFTVTTCSDSSGKVRALSVGRKLTQTPPEAGTITSGIVEWREDIAESTVRLLDSVKLVGMANTEFKLDENTREFYAMETNPRPGMWNYSTLLSGVDMYGILLDDPPREEPVRIGRRPAVWSLAGRRGITRSIRDPKLRKTARELVRRGEIYDPRNSPEEGFPYRVALAAEKLRTFLGYRYRAWVSRRSIPLP